jgi:hypothetical protein
MITFKDKNLKIFFETCLMRFSLRWMNVEFVCGVQQEPGHIIGSMGEEG